MIITKFSYLYCFFLLLFTGCAKDDKNIDPADPVEETEETDEQETSAVFTNPLMTKGADPWITQKDGMYYYTYTHGSKVVLFVTEKVSELNKAEPVDIWVPPPGTMYSSNIWAPEIHNINGNWYIYFAADNGSNANHRMYVIENTSENPVRGKWEFKGKVSDPTDEWAIDGSVITYNDQLYMLWSGSDAGRSPQHIYIARMSNPWTIEGERVQISTPQHEWEMHRGAINEGPQPIFNPDGKLFVVFSASSFLSDNYALGLLSLKEGGDPMNPSDWEKKPTPVFTMNAESGTFGPGHNGFFKSPDGTEDWIIYHARNLPDNGSTNYRNPRIQKFSWNDDGTPNFGKPVKIGDEIESPSGE